MNAEVRNYLCWLLQRQPLATLLMPIEWLAILIRAVIVHRSSTPERPTPLPVREPAAFFFELDHMPAIAGQARRLFADQVQAVLHAAEQICAGQLPLPTGVNWPHKPHSWRPVVDDIEHLFALNRWTFGVTLAKAWQYTGEARYATRWLELWRDWAQANPPDTASPVWESYSVGERLIHWCQSLALLWSSPDFQAIHADLVAALAQHAEWLAAHLETEQAHNHLINNARALYVYGALFGQAAPQAMGWEILERELSRQVLPNGFLGEQSTHYHLLLTRTYVELVLIARRLQQPLSPEFTDHVRRMLECAVALIRPDGSLPLIGDVSPDTDLQSLVGIIGAGRLKFGLSQHPILAEASAWYLTTADLTAWATASADEPSAQVDWPQAGYSVYQAPDRQVVCYADPRGAVLRHGHVDALGVTLWSRGHDVLIDAGQATYAAGVWFNYFHGPTAHNTLTIDDLPSYLVPSRSRRLMRADYWQARAVMSKPQQQAQWWWAEASHTGYRRLWRPVDVTRRVIVAPEYVWITDWVTSEGSHVFDATWHFGGNTLQLQEPGQWAIMHDTHWLAQALWLHNGRPITPTVISGQIAPVIQGWYSPAYGHTQPGTTATWRARFSRSARLDLVLMFEANLVVYDLKIDDGGDQIVTAAWRDVVVREPASGQLKMQRL